MKLHDRLTWVHKPTHTGSTPTEEYLKRLITSLYDLGMVSNSTEPTMLPTFDDRNDLVYLMEALDTLKNDVISELLE